MGIASRQIGKFLRKQLDLFDDAPDAPTEKSSVPKVKEEKDPQETITVFPKPQRMWEDKRLGGDYINPKTGDVLTDKQPLSANINVRSGKPKFTISNQNTDKIGSDSGYNVKVNLFKKSAGWRDADVPKGADSELNNLPSLVSVVSRGKHYYTTDVNFTKGVQLKKYPNKQDEPKLRPTVPKGNLDLGTIMGYVNVRGKKHPVYDSIKVYSSGGLSMNKQMELFEEGGQVDPVSGNDVPLGSTEEEVRDDQPAMLSEGEMVIPADVVRYFGVEHFMKLRDEAKMGYKKMEAMGQFGTEEGQTLPDDTLFNAGGPPFTIEDIEVIEPDDLESLEGGEEDTLEANAGAFVQGGQETNPFDNNAATTAGQQFAAGKPITASSFSQPAFTFDSFKGFSGLTSDYIQSFLPDAFKNKKPKLASLATNLLDTFYGDMLRQQAQGASTKAGQSDLPDAGGKSDLSSATPGIGSVSELMSNPSTASLGSLAGLGAMLDSTIGRATLSAMDLGIGSMGLTPSKSSMGPVGGLMAAASALSPTISRGFDVVNNVATMDAARAKNAAASIKADFAALSPAEIADINTLAAFNSISNATGYDPTVDPAVDAVGTTSTGAPGYSVGGRFGATYGWNDEIGWEVTLDQITNPATPTDLKNTKNKASAIADRGSEAGQVGAVDVDPTGSEGLAGGPGGVNEGPAASQNQSPSHGDQEHGGGPDQDDGPEADGGAVGGTDNDDDGDDTGGPDGEGEGEDGGPEGIAKGGLIKRKPRNKKRGGRKRKKRGGLGSRK